MLPTHKKLSLIHMYTCHSLFPVQGDPPDQRLNALLGNAKIMIRAARRGGANRPPKTNVGTETAFRHDHGKHFQKIKVNVS